MLEAVSELLGAGALFLGLSLATIAMFGLLRMPNVFHQLHAAGLISGPAVVLVLLASLGTGNLAIITSAALVLLFVVVTAPMSSHAIAEAALHQARSADESPGPTTLAATADIDPLDVDHAPSRRRMDR